MPDIEKIKTAISQIDLTSFKFQVEGEEHNLTELSDIAWNPLDPNKDQDSASDQLIALGNKIIAAAPKETGGEYESGSEEQGIAIALAIEHMRKANMSEALIGKVILQTTIKMVERETHLDGRLPLIQAGTLLLGGMINPAYLIARMYSAEVGPKVKTDKALLKPLSKVGMLLLATSVAIPFLPIITTVTIAATCLLGIPSATRFCAHMNAALNKVPEREMEKKAIKIMDSALKAAAGNAQDPVKSAKTIYTTMQTALEGTDKTLLEKKSREAVKNTPDMINALKSVQRGIISRMIDFTFGFNIGGGKKDLAWVKGLLFKSRTSLKAQPVGKWVASVLRRKPQQPQQQARRQ